MNLEVVHRGRIVDVLKFRYKPKEIEYRGTVYRVCGGDSLPPRIVIPASTSCRNYVAERVSLVILAGKKAMRQTSRALRRWKGKDVVCFGGMVYAFNPRADGTVTIQLGKPIHAEPTKTAPGRRAR